VVLPEYSSSGKEEGEEGEGKRRDCFEFYFLGFNIHAEVTVNVTVSRSGMTSLELLSSFKIRHVADTDTSRR
jgi:hypothetical protein